MAILPQTDRELFDQPPPTAAESGKEGSVPGQVAGEPRAHTNDYVVGASEYGGPGDPSSGHVGSCGHNLVGRSAFAELNMGTALGGLPCGTKVYLQTYKGTGATVSAEKQDIGTGGLPVENHMRRVDIWWETAKQMGLPGNGTWTGLIRIRRADGKPIIGPLHSETKEGQAIPSGINIPAVANPLEWLKEVGKVFHFLGSSAGWARIGKVVGGSVLLMIALAELGKIGTGSEANIKGTIQKTLIG